MAFEFKINQTDGNARTGVLQTPHGEIPTPIFMPVGTQGVVKALTAEDLEILDAPIILANTYHMAMRPGEALVKKMGGVHGFASWKRALLTDSGGFQVFSLAALNKLSEEGVEFQSHIDGSKHMFSPEHSMRVQKDLGADIAMAFDHCVKLPATRDEVVKAKELTTRWLKRCIEERKTFTLASGTNEDFLEHQALFGIVQGGLEEDLRVEHAQELGELDLPGYAIGGLSVGESVEDLHRMTAHVAPHLPAHKPRYLMGVGTPLDLVRGVASGVDMFDCVMPTRNARMGTVFTWEGRMNIKSAKYKEDAGPIMADCGCPACARYSRSYLRHLFKAKEMTSSYLLTMHNLWFYLNLMTEMREAIQSQSFQSWTQKRGFVL
jgi:queuine tRNA-ribosyltransferase